MSDLMVLAAILGAVGVASLALRTLEGRVSAGGRARVTEADRVALGLPVAGPLLLELTAPGCAPCVTAGRVLSDEADAAAAAGLAVAFVAVDVADAPGLARAHRVLRAPTTLVVAADGVVVGRIGGVPDPGGVRALLAVAAGGGSGYGAASPTTEIAHERGTAAS